MKVFAALPASAHVRFGRWQRGHVLAARVLRDDRVVVLGHRQSEQRRQKRPPAGPRGRPEVEQVAEQTGIVEGVEDREPVRSAYPHAVSVSRFAR